MSERIEVVSVDRFLEHSRVYWFLNGGEEEIYLANADWMTRNFDKRIELRVSGGSSRPQEQSAVGSAPCSGTTATRISSPQMAVTADAERQRRAKQRFRVQQVLLGTEAQRASALARA